MNELQAIVTAIGNASQFLIGTSLGAIIAVGTGWATDELRAWRERNRELESILISISDEIAEIEGTITKMHEVWTQAKVLPSSYITELRGSTGAFDALRLRLFLIQNGTLRKKIVSFYKKLKDTARKSEGKLGTLAETAEAIAEQGQFDTEFQTLGTEAADIRRLLESMSAR